MRITIIGCGHMGSALAERLSKKYEIALFDSSFDKAKSLSKKTNAKFYKSSIEAIKEADLVILAVKPKDIEKVANSFNLELKENQLIISLLAGVSIKSLQKYFPKKSLLRMMPNLAVVYGRGVVGLCDNDKMNKKERTIIDNVFNVLGSVYWLSEKKMDALTSLAGSGPAFFFVIIESIIESGIAMGFNVKESKQIVYQMLKGSLDLIENSSKHLGELKWEIASPGGTTMAGLKALEECSLRSSIMNTFIEAYRHTQK